jgi:hypothetical protein
LVKVAVADIGGWRGGGAAAAADIAVCVRVCLCVVVVLWFYIFFIGALIDLPTNFDIFY